MNEEELEKEIKKLSKKLKLVDEYKEYKKLQKAIKNNDTLNKINNEIETLKKRLPLSGKKVQHDLLIKIQALKKEYDNHPLVVNYKQLRSQLLSAIAPLQEIKL